MDKDEAIYVLLDMIWQATRRGYIMGTVEREAYLSLRKEYPR